jgi:hypothetical protein
MTKVLILYYSAYGHMERMIHSVQYGTRGGPSQIIVNAQPTVSCLNLPSPKPRATSICRISGYGEPAS